jgi:hypothetical protein
MSEVPLPARLAAPEAADRRPDAAEKNMPDLPARSSTEFFNDEKAERL